MQKRSHHVKPCAPAEDPGHVGGGNLGDPGRRDHHPPVLGGIARLGVLTGAYGLQPERAGELIDVILDERAHSTANIQAEIANGNPSWIRDWAAAGGDDRAVEDDAWIERHRTALIRSTGRFSAVD